MENPATESLNEIKEVLKTPRYVRETREDFSENDAFVEQDE